MTLVVCGGSRGLKSRRTAGQRALGWLALALAFPTPSLAQNSTILGRVVDHESGRPLADVAVSLLTMSNQVITSTTGHFTFTQLEAGLYQLRFQLLGYAERTDSIRLASDDIAELEVRLVVAPIGLPPLEVTVNTGTIASWLASRGFAKRGLEGRAMLHMTHQQLALRPFGNLRDLLRTVSGVRIRRLANAGSELLLDPDPGTGQGSCKVAVYLNGSNVEFGRFNWTGVDWRQRASRPIRFDDLVRIEEIDGIELYGPEDNPVAPDSTCGTLMIWSAMLRPTVDEDLTGEIKGSAIDALTGSVLSGVRVIVEGTGLSALTDANGRFEIPDVLPGTYRISAEYPDARPWQATVGVRAYGIVDLQLRLERGQPGRTPRPSVSASQPANSTSANTKFMPRNALRCLPPQPMKGSNMGKAVETPSPGCRRAPGAS